MYSKPTAISMLYEDQDLRVFNKPANISLLADRSGANNLWEHIKTLGEKPYLVHRLDKGTSGILLIARNQACQRELTRAFNARLVHKFYLAKVVGHFPTGRTYKIDLPLCKGRKSRYRVAGDRERIKLTGTGFSVEQNREGVQAITLARYLGRRNGHSWLLLKPTTGRTHQLRVHLSWLDFPIVGDHLYGKPNSVNQQAPRMMLHCHRLIVPGRGNFSVSDADFLC